MGSLSVVIWRIQLQIHRNTQKILWNWTTFKLIYQSSYNSLFKGGKAIDIKQIKFTCTYLRHFIKWKAEGEILQLVNAWGFHLWRPGFKALLRQQSSTFTDVSKLNLIVVPLKYWIFPCIWKIYSSSTKSNLLCTCFHQPTSLYWHNWPLPFIGDIGQNKQALFRSCLRYSASRNKLNCATYLLIGLS